nr:dephospho-CoA kinase [Acutalibacter sp. 1XD8-36]
MVVGLTGSSGAGKSTAAEGLVRRGFRLIDCDRLTRREDVYDSECIEALARAFGQDVAPGGRLDRRKLAGRAFRDAGSVKLLGELTFPAITRAVRRELCGMDGPVLLDAPTLFESGLDSICRRILAVTAPEEVRIRRVMARDGLDEAEALARFSAQHPEEYYIQRADLAVDNGGDVVMDTELDRICAELKGDCR